MIDRPRTLKDVIAAAEQAQRQGDLATAMALYTQVLAKAPGHSKARKAVQNLRRMGGSGRSLSQGDVDQVLAQMQAGRFAEAAEATRALILIAPKEALLFNILGMALVNSDRASEAVQAFEKCVRLKPNYPEALSNLGSALVSVNQYDRALPYLENAVRLNPGLAEAHHNIAVVLRQRARYDEALVHVERALGVRPNYPNALNTKGSILQDCDRIDEAIATFQAGLALEPGNSDIQISLGSAYAAAGRLEDALATLEAALPAMQDTADPQHRIGVILGELGRKDDAVGRLEQALSADPTLADGYRSLSMLKKFKPGDPMIAQMQTLFDAPDCPASGRMHLGFALGKAYEDTGDFDRAFACLDVGNREKRKIVMPYSTEMRQAEVAGIKAFFDQAFVDRMAKVASQSQKPIFVVGMNRSGTTLVEQILASHSQVFGAGELINVDRFMQTHLRRLATVTDGEFAEFATGYVAHLTRLGGDCPRVTDKLPANFKWIGLIKAVLPRAKIINLNRDPRDNCLSIYKNIFGSAGNQYAYDLVELAEYYVTYRDLMDHWHAMFPGEIYECHYEALTADQEAGSRALLEYCGLDWEAGVLDFHKTERIVHTASVGQVREKIYRSSVASWKRFEVQLAPLFEVLARAGRLPDDR